MPRRNGKIRRYAEGTTVAVDESRSELEALLKRHGATSFGVYNDPSKWTVMFQLSGRYVKHVIPVLKQNGGPVPEGEVRRRWRVLVLITKAKLELVAGGDSSVEREFLADTVLAEGMTVYEAASSAIAESYQLGVTPRLLGTGGA